MMLNMQIGFLIATVVTLIACCYTMQFHGAIVDLSRKLVGKQTMQELITSAEAENRPVSDDALRDVLHGDHWALVNALTPVSQKITYWIFALAVWIIMPIFSAILFRWWAIPLILGLNYYMLRFLGQLLPSSTSPYFVQKIVAGLHSKRSACEKKGDLLGAEVYKSNLLLIHDLYHAEMEQAKNTA